MKKIPPRKVVRAEQQNIQRLQSLASFEPYVDHYRFAGIRYHEDGTPVVMTEREKGPWEDDNAKPKTLREAAERLDAPRKHQLAMLAPLTAVCICMKRLFLGPLSPCGRGTG